MVSKRVLVTGLNGFTGHYVAQQFESAGWTVYGLGDRDAPLERFHVVNLGNVPALRDVVAEVNPHAVVHLAGIAFVGHGDANAFYNVNLIGTRNLLEAVTAEGAVVESVLLASSANVYGNSAEGVLKEDSPACPANDYAVSKLAMEHVARLWHHRLPIVIARPFNYTGVGQTESFLIPKIVGHFRRNARQIQLGNLDVFRDFSDVRAVALAYRRLIEACPSGQVFNVCSGRLHSLRDVVSLLEQLAGYKIDIRVNPEFVRPNEVRSLCGSAEKLQGVIGDLEMPPLADTLSWMYHASEQ